MTWDLLVSTLGIDLDLLLLTWDLLDFDLVLDSLFHSQELRLTCVLENNFVPLFTLSTVFFSMKNKEMESKGLKC